MVSPPLPAFHYSPLGLRYTVAVSLLMGMMILQLTSYIFWVLAALSHPVYHTQFNTEVIYRIISLYTLTIATGLLILLACWRLHQQQRWDMRLCYVSIVLYSGIMLVAGYGIGTLTLVYGFALAGVPFLLLFLLPLPAVVGMAALCLVSWLVLSGLAVEGYIPYAPSYTVFSLKESSTAIRFQFWSQVFYVVPLAVATAVGGYFIRMRWQQLQQHSRSQNQLDSVTRALNRTALMKVLEQQLPTGADELSVVLIQLERLAEIQQRCGFGVADYLLMQSTEAIRQQIRAQDQVGMLADDQWVLVMGGASSRVAAILTDRCRQAIVQQVVVGRDGTQVVMRVRAVVLTLDALHRQALSSQQLLDCLRHELNQRCTVTPHWLRQVQVDADYLLYGLNEVASPVPSSAPAQRLS